MRARLFKDQRGDTIMEVLICVAMLGFMLGTAFTLTNRNQLTNRASQERSEATKIAEKQVEYLRGYYAKNAKNSTDIIANESFCFDDSGNIQDNTPNSPNDNISQDGEDKYISVCKPSPNGYSYRVNIWKAGTPAANNLSSDGGAHVVTVRWDNIRGGTPEEVKVFYSIDKVDALYYGGQYAQGGGVTGIPACNDAIDNDGDGFNNKNGSNFEVGCDSASDTSEADPIPSTNSFSVNRSIWSNSYNTVEYYDGTNPADSTMNAANVFDINLAGVTGSKYFVINYQNDGGYGGTPNTAAPSYKPYYSGYEIKYCVSASRSSCTWSSTIKLPVNRSNTSSPLSSLPLRADNIQPGQHLYVAWINNYWSSLVDGAGVNQGFDPNFRINTIDSYSVEDMNVRNAISLGDSYTTCTAETSSGDSYDGCSKDTALHNMYAYRRFSNLTYLMPAPSVIKGPLNIEIKYRNKNWPGKGVLGSVDYGGATIPIYYSLRINTGGSNTGLLLPTSGTDTAQRTYLGQIYVANNLPGSMSLSWDNDYSSATADHNLQIDSVRILRP